MTIIAADIGASKTLLGNFARQDSVSDACYFDNSRFSSFDQVLEAYLEQNPAILPASSVLVVAVAGQVYKNIRCQMTNLPWQLDANHLQQEFGFSRALLLNDLEATAFAMPQPTMAPCLEPLNGMAADFTKAVTVISVGTGLGQAMILPSHNNQYRVMVSEGGHKSFAPFDSQSASLLARTLASHPAQYSWEHWFSGSGLPLLYQAMFPNNSPLTSAAITQQAAQNPASAALQCIEFFVQGLMAEAGNLALQYQSHGGVIFAGGVAQHIAPWLRQARLQRPFCQKSRHTDWLQQLPIVLCTRTDAALLGAAAYGWQSG